jgi:hypothetical protein
MAIAQPARYITTAHSPLCCETNVIAGPRECLGSPGPPRTPQRVGTLNFKLKDTSPRWHGSVGHDAQLPARFPLCVATSPGPSDRIRRVGALYCFLGSVSARLNLVGANRRPDAVMALHGRTPGQGRGNPPTRRTPDIDKNAPLSPDRTRDGQCASRTETQ